MNDNRISWEQRRLGFHCHCEKCIADLGPISRKHGKFWQAKYGESAQEFKRRYKEHHYAA